MVESTGVAHDSPLVGNTTGSVGLKKSLATTAQFASAASMHCSTRLPAASWYQSGKPFWALTPADTAGAALAVAANAQSTASTAAASMARMAHARAAVNSVVRVVPEVPVALDARPAVAVTGAGCPDPEGCITSDRMFTVPGLSNGS